MKKVSCTILALAGAASLQAATYVIDVDLLTTNTNPDTSSNSPAGASGTFFGAYDDVTNVLGYTMTWQQLSGPPASPGAHIHGPAPLGSNAGIQFFILTGTEPGLASSGSTTGSFTLSEAQESDLLSNLYYVNLHTAANGSGEIRGQINPSAIPEPGVAGLAGLALLGLALRRRK